MASRPALDNVLSHWSTLIEDLQASPLEFYKAVEAALARRQVPATKNSRVDYREGGVASASREYLQITREKLVFDVCAAPFGTGFFVSWWLAEAKQTNPIVRLGSFVALFVLLAVMFDQFGAFVGPVAFVVLLALAMWGANWLVLSEGLDDNIIRDIPLVGRVYDWLFKSGTYYRIDTTDMYRKAVHNAVLEVIDELTSAKGVRALADVERRPVLREFYNHTAA